MLVHKLPSSITLEISRRVTLPQDCFAYGYVRWPVVSYELRYSIHVAHIAENVGLQFSEKKNVTAYCKKRKMENLTLYECWRLQIRGRIPGSYLVRRFSLDKGTKVNNTVRFSERKQRQQDRFSERKQRQQDRFSERKQRQKDRFSERKRRQEDSQVLRKEPKTTR